MNDQAKRTAPRHAAPDEAEGSGSGGGPPQWNTEEERWAAVETAIELARRRGEFDNLPGAGKPLKGIDKPRDPDWWIKQKVESEGLTGFAPPVFQLRKEHERLEETLDELLSESRVREYLTDFNQRVREARRQLHGGPPVVTPTRDIDAEVTAWEERRAARKPAETTEPTAPQARRRRWWNRGRGKQEA
ncbi:DUF1992 domain-containing protein [Paramicrobacterium chengjingii]|uniref:DUF1992 domain-containing protein n=1 Tax=Paramicrobacterium chengjingii TaxID=2769067 RepID=A0ABX6YGL5_9MICO|nr:DUF1992 domain-containing protein [Microbacterium chengjingii]QPZ37896.1 DUF1992 domain-containing protein [Microbacterium chengjingii]